MKPQCKMEILNFNHISDNLTENEITALQNLYKHNHIKTWCFKKAYKHYKRVNAALTLSSITLTITGTVVGGVTLNPVILGVISGSGVLLQTFLKMKNYN